MSTVYISPTGSGNKSGSDWANAMAVDYLNSAIKKAGTGGSVLLAADLGTYKVTSPINISAAGTEAASVTVSGVSSKTGQVAEAVFEGNRTANWTSGSAAGNELFKFQKGAANLTFENLQVNNTGTVFRAAADVNNIKIQHVDAENVARFFEDYAGGGNSTAVVANLTIRDVEVKGFSEGVVRLQYGSHDVLIEDVIGDSRGQDGEFAIGVHLHGAAHDVVIRKTTMMNAKYTGTGYWNGDGFATEVGVKNVLFEDTVASGNADAGYDLKSTATKLVRAVSSDNAHNYRIWGEAEMVDSVGIDPHARGGTGGQYQVWVKGTGSLTMTGGKLEDSGANTTVFAAGANLKISGTEIVMADTARLGGAIQPRGLLASAVTKIATTGAFSTAGAIIGAVTGTATPPATDGAKAVTATTTTTATKVVEAVTTKAVETMATVKAVETVATKIADTAAGVTKFASTSANDKFVATTGADLFFFDQKAKIGADTITGFGKTDVFATSQAIKDGNGDGLIDFGKNGMLDFGSAVGNVALDKVAGLRFLGQTGEGFLYADAAVRPKGALEGKLGVADILAGDAGDKKAGSFFFDTALDRDLGADKVTQFGAKDVIVTTDKLADVAVGTKVSATAAGSFALVHDGHDVGSLTIADLAGKAVTTLEFDGERFVGDVHYYVYSSVGSAAGLAQVAF